MAGWLQYVVAYPWAGKKFAVVADARPAIATQPAVPYDHRRVATKGWHAGCAVGGLGAFGRGRSCRGADGNMRRANPVKKEIGPLSAVERIFGAVHRLPFGT